MKSNIVRMAHGSGGKAMNDLIQSVFREAFASTPLNAADDFAVLKNLPAGDVIFTTDSYVVSPLFFPGGDIGSLAVHGTVNDIAMSGGKPLYLSVGFILEEGFAIADLEKIVASMAQAAKEAGVVIATGDTKVVEKGKGDGIYINTSGLGVRNANLSIAGVNAKPGDAIIVNGPIGDHGVTILSQREQLDFASDIQSDSAPLNGIVGQLMDHFADGIHVMRDATRGGVAAVLNEIATQSGVAIELDEASIPIADSVAATCELLGLDPLFIANEGKFVCMCDESVADAVLSMMRKHKYGIGANIIGTVANSPIGAVTMETSMGGKRFVEWPHGELLPRIC